MVTPQPAPFLVREQECDHEGPGAGAEAFCVKLKLWGRKPRTEEKGSHFIS